MTNFVSSIPLTFTSTPDPLGAAPKVIVNAFSANGWLGTNIVTDVPTLPPHNAVSTVITYTAGTLKTILSLTGSGAIYSLTARMADGTSRTMRIKITIDGTVAFDSTSGSPTAVNYGGLIITNDTPFAVSLLIEAATSNTESAPFVFTYRYRTN
jgi:hypothetical protein